MMTVKFREPLSAQACIIVSSKFPSASFNLKIPQKMQGRFFSGRRVEASLYSGKERYNRTIGGGDDDQSDMEVDGDEKKRLDDFADWLMNEED